MKYDLLKRNDNGEWRTIKSISDIAIISRSSAHSVGYFEGCLYICIETAIQSKYVAYQMTLDEVADYGTPKFKLKELLREFKLKELI